jgi:hypothetical protein
MSRASPLKWNDRIHHAREQHHPSIKWRLRVVVESLVLFFVAFAMYKMFVA